MKRSGQMTVFLAMVILCICALMSGLLESARTAGTRWYFKMAAASSLDSVMSGFHRGLWDRYICCFWRRRTRRTWRMRFSSI